MNKSYIVILVKENEGCVRYGFKDAKIVLSRYAGFIKIQGMSINMAWVVVLHEEATEEEYNKCDIKL